jgi:hypothetical protein
MEVVLQYFDGCPGWRLADARLHSAMSAAGVDAPVRYVEIATIEAAERLGFVGSPTILIDGHDPFRPGGAVPGLACRRYETREGVEPAPSIEQIVTALRGG